jgi:hypothetical protein
MSDETTLRAELADALKRLDAHYDSRPPHGSLAWEEWHATEIALARERARIRTAINRARYAARVLSDGAPV